MLELPINQYNITEVKYKLSETKTVTFKLHNFMLKDVDVEDTSKKMETAETVVKPENIVDKQYAIDRTIIDEHEAVKEKKINDNFNKVSNVDKERCKELMHKIDDIPYKVYEKIGELRTFGKNEGIFVNEQDPYVVNDERELPKQKRYALTEKEQKTLDASKEKEWKDSMKNDIITNPIIVTVDLDKKYKNLSTGEKREISKKLIEKDAKEDSKIIKERIENSIGTNEPLSEELINAPEERSYNEKEWVNNDLEKCKNIVSDVFKKARDKALETKLILEVEDEREATE